MLLLAKDFSCFEFTAMMMSTPSNFSSFTSFVFKPKYSKWVLSPINIALQKFSTLEDPVFPPSCPLSLEGSYNCKDLSRDIILQP